MSEGVEATSATESGAISHEQLAGLFKAEIDAENSSGAGAEPAPATAPAETELAEAPTEAAEPEEELQRTEAEPVEPASEPHDEAPATPAIEPPAGMSEADRSQFAKLSPESQKWVSERIRGQQADYTQKTQAVAQERQAVNNLAQQHLQKIQAYDAILSKFANPDIAPPDPALQMTDLPRFQAEMANYVQAKHIQELAQKEQTKLAAEHAALTKQNQSRYLQEEGQKLIAMNPDFGHPEKGPQLRKMAFEYATKSGYTPQELQMASAKDVLTLWKAAQYDAASKVKATTVPVQSQAPKSAKPGPAKAAVRGGMTSAIQNLNASPTRENLAAAYLAEIASER